MLDRKVIAVDPDGNATTIAEVPGQPGGLGWLTDGRLLVVSMTDQRLLVLEPDGLREAAGSSYNGKRYRNYYCSRAMHSREMCAY